jgi:hypothetical protein
MLNHQVTKKHEGIVEFLRPKTLVRIRELGDLVVIPFLN